MDIKQKKKLFQLLSLEYNCEPEDFIKNENVLTTSALKEGRRKYSEKPYFFQMVTTGNNAVLTADERIHSYLADFIKNKTGHGLFEMQNLLPLERELNLYGYSLTGTFHMFLSYSQVRPVKEYPVKWFYGNEIRQFYGDKRFPNAIAPYYLEHRPDTIVVCAYEGEKIIGMAGCSEDAPHWQQIGIDVMPGHRSKGVGTYLVTLLKNKVIEQGDTPFYGTSVSNYHSWNIALNCGFRPAFVEIGAKKSD